MKTMRVWCFRRLGVAIAVVALLLVGFGMSSGMAAPPCGMGKVAMAAAMVGPCSDQDAPGNPEKAPSSLACFVKCPAPVLDRAGVPVVAPALIRASFLASHPAVPIGIGVAPLFDPPRV